MQTKRANALPPAPKSGDASPAPASHAAPLLRGKDLAGQVQMLTPRAPQRLSGGLAVQRRAVDDAAPHTAPTAPFVEACDAPPNADGEAAAVDDRIAVQQLVNELGRALNQRRINLASNYIENIRRYTAETGADGGLALARAGFVALAAKGAIKTAVTTPPKTGLEQLFKRWTGSELSVVGKAFNSFLVGLIFDVLVDLLFDPTGKALRAAYRKGAEAGANTVAGAAQQALADLSRGAAEDQVLLDELTRAIQGMTTRQDLQGIAEWMRAQVATLAVPVADYSLYEGMLETWVLQRAGDEEDGNKHTDSEAYDAAHDKLAPDGDLARRDLFIHQSRYAFGRLGIDGEPTLALWQRRLNANAGVPAEEAIAGMGPLRLEVTQFANPQRLVQTLVAESTADLMLMLTADLASARKHVAEEEPGWPVIKDITDYTERFLATAASGGIVFSCDVDLTEADGAIFVNRFAYRMGGARHKSNGEPNNKHDAPIPPCDWTDSPD